MLNIGPAEAVVILVFALILLGPQKLPELARGIGKFMREFRRQTDDVRGMVEREFYKMDEQLRLDDPPVQPSLHYQDPSALPVVDPHAPNHDTIPHEGLEPPSLGASLGTTLIDEPSPAFPKEGSRAAASSAGGTSDTLEMPPVAPEPLPTLKPPEGTVSRQAARTIISPPPPSAPVVDAPEPQAAVKPGDS